ncbi:MAG: hypothetical protein DRP09_10455 [Candidatus Thorarchaeota archaeon]|nr:MAG: hypothetical protein DRP09_10455 [Candidatus Thorarchaeota archaeon]
MTTTVTTTNQPIRTIEKGGYRLEIFQDEYTENPRKTNDNFGTIVTIYGKYGYGDIKTIDPEEYIKDLSDEMQLLTLPIYVYDHSGIAPSTGQFRCPWDSGQIGFIFISHEKIKEELGELTVNTIDQARKNMESEIKELGLWINGSVYGYILTEIKTCKCCHQDIVEVLDSQWGFITDDPEKIFHGMINRDIEKILREE